MPLVKRLVPQKPYFPIRGISPDTNSLSAGAEDAITARNIEFTQDEFKMRSGTRQLGFNVPTMNPVLHTQSLKKPNGKETLFVFTKNCIYGLDPSDSYWYIASREVLKNAFDVTTNLSSTAGVLTADTSYYWSQAGSDVKSVKVTYTGAPSVTLTNGNIILKQESMTDWALDATPYNLVGFYYYNNSASDIAATISFYTSVDCSTGLVESFDITLTADDIFRDCLLRMTTPANYDVKSWKITVRGNQTVANSFAIYFDHLSVIEGTPADCTFWSSTRILDTNEGETIVAASSVPAAPNEAESDQASRGLFYYDLGDLNFQALVMYAKINTTYEDTGTNIPNTASATTANALANVNGTTQTYVRGSLSIYSAGAGTLFSDSLLAAVGGNYPLITSDATLYNAAIASSYLSSSTWKTTVTTLTANFAGERMYVDYTYKKATAYKPRFVWSFQNRLFFANTYEGSAYFPWRVRWTDVGDITTFDDLVSYQDTVELDSTPIVAGAMLGPYLMIYKHNSIERVTFDSANNVFVFTPVVLQGTYSGRTVQCFDTVHFFLGKEDVYMFDGSSVTSATRRTDTGMYAIRMTILNALDPLKAYRCFANINYRQREYWLWIIEQGETYPTTAYVYSILTKSWTIYKFAGVTYIGEFLSGSDVSINALVGTIDDQNWTFEGGNLTTLSRVPIVCPQAGGVYLYDGITNTDWAYTDVESVYHAGTAISGYLITHDFLSSVLSLKDRTQRVDLEAQGTELTIGWSSQYATNLASFSQKSTLSLASNYTTVKYHPDVVAEHLRFSLEATGQFGVRWLVPYVLENEVYGD